jgi:uncharacterized protein (TIGR02246 family)
MTVTTPVVDQVAGARDFRGRVYDAFERGDIAELVDWYSTNAVLVVGDQTASGADAIRGFYEALFRDYDVVWCKLRDDGEWITVDESTVINTVQEDVVFAEKASGKQTALHIILSMVLTRADGRWRAALKQVSLCQPLFT